MPITGQHRRQLVGPMMESPPALRTARAASNRYWTWNSAPRTKSRAEALSVGRMDSRRHLVTAQSGESHRNTRTSHCARDYVGIDAIACGLIHST